MLIKIQLNKVERFKSFVYGSICLVIIDDLKELDLFCCSLFSHHS